MILAVMLVSAALAFTAGQQEGSGSGGMADGERPVIRVLSGGWFGTDYNDVGTTAVLEDRFNIDLDITTTGWGNEYLQRQQIIMASGDYPEIMTITTNALEVDYAESGALLPLNEYFSRFPNLATYVSQDHWNVMRFPDGNIYAVPTTSALADGTAISQTRVMTYRSDWLEELGFDVPTTTEEYFDVAVAMSTQDPDGNGENDTYALIGQDGNVQFFVGIMGAFGGGRNIWIDTGDGVENLALQPGTKDALRYLNRLWEAGAIDPEFITDNNDRWRQKWLRGVAGAPYIFGHLADTANYDGFRAQFKANVPDGEWAIGPTLTAPGYEDVAHGGEKLSTRGWMRSVIVAPSKNAEEALPLLDFMASRDGMFQYTYGEAGTDYEINADGSVTALASEERKADYGINLYHVPIIRPASFAHMTPYYQEWLKQWEEERLTQAIDGLLIAEVGEYNQILEDYVNDEFVKMIIGETQIDGGYERFIQEFNRRGGAELQEALNAAAGY
jgi:ABC-type glycerol-3-phosphate transport system substrate-binding protein